MKHKDVCFIHLNNYLNMVDYSFGSSHDELIADEVFKGLPKDHHSIWVFNRIKP